MSEDEIAYVTPPRATPRTSIVRHAERMEAKLRQRDNRADWVGTHPSLLIRWLRKEVEELEGAYLAYTQSKVGDMFGADTQPIRDEAADVALLSMMVVDAIEQVKGEHRGRKI